MMQNTGYIIKSLRESCGMTQQQLAEIMGMKSYTTITKWEKGENSPKGKDIVRLSELFNVSANYLFGIEEPKHSNLIEISPATVKIPILGTIACGDPILAEENFKGYRYESPDRLPSGNLIYLEAKGDSMEPTIPNGSYVLIREQPEVEYGEVAAVRVNGNTEATLKRIKKHGNTILLMPDNPKHDPIVVDENNPITVIGKAVKVEWDL